MNKKSENENQDFRFRFKFTFIHPAIFRHRFLCVIRSGLTNVRVECGECSSASYFIVHGYLLWDL